MWRKILRCLVTSRFSGDPHDQHEGDARWMVVELMRCMHRCWKSLLSCVVVILAIIFVVAFLWPTVNIFHRRAPSIVGAVLLLLLSASAQLLCRVRARSRSCTGRQVVTDNSLRQPCHQSANLVHATAECEHQHDFVSNREETDVVKLTKSTEIPVVSMPKSRSNPDRATADRVAAARSIATKLAASAVKRGVSAGTSVRDDLVQLSKPTHLMTGGGMNELSYSWNKHHMQGEGTAISGMHCRMAAAAAVRVAAAQALDAATFDAKVLA